jgi:hypothetical protein
MAKCFDRKRKDQQMEKQPNHLPGQERKTSRQIYNESLKIGRQVDDGKPRLTEDEIQRQQFGPRGVPGKPDPAKMVPQRRKKTPSDFDPGHTA